MFIDTAKITLKAGDGGNGAVSFHREKYVAAGGPDGGDGGDGGSIILIPDDNISTLMDFRYRRKYTAQNGANGSGSRCKGKKGQDLVLRVPRGTIVRDAATNEIIVDMSSVESFVIAKGGRGGWGNQHFATPTRQVPRFAKAGLPGVSREIILELKLLADVGLLGFPNVGKSTLLSVVTRADPKIANYHFTTLSPNLGVVPRPDGKSFVIADIPGIIEGAAEGAGLGHDFLRHIDRCRLLIHMVDISGSEGRDPVNDFETINDELYRYSSELSERPQIVAANKCDILREGDETAENFRGYIKRLGLPYFEISAATHMGVEALMNAVSEKLSELPPVKIYEPEYIERFEEPEYGAEIKIEVYDDVYTVDAPWLARIMANVNFSDYESRMYFDRVLRKAGVFDKLEEAGINEGDTVSIYDLEFEYRR
ncbi:MAG: GTPase ObgE [Oscillospiraceae bacterium]|jgi:GTP-binding protein